MNAAPITRRMINTTLSKFTVFYFNCFDSGGGGRQHHLKEGRGRKNAAPKRRRVERAAPPKGGGSPAAPPKGEREVEAPPLQRRRVQHHPKQHRPRVETEKTGSTTQKGWREKATPFTRGEQHHLAFGHLVRLWLMFGLTYHFVIVSKRFFLVRHCVCVCVCVFLQ